jgi:hypothetical protein
MTNLQPAKNLYTCPKCGSTEFTADVITQYEIEIYKDGDMIPLHQVEKAQQDNIDDGSVMCANCDEYIDVRTILKLSDHHLFGTKEGEKQKDERLLEAIKDCKDCRFSSCEKHER